MRGVPARTRGVAGSRRHHRLLLSLAAAAVGAGVVFAVHFARPWAERTPHDCGTFADCANPVVGRYLVLAVIVVLASLVVMVLSCKRRALLVVPVAFATQGLLMLLVEHADGYWLPLPLDLLLAASCWAATALALGSPSEGRRPSALRQPVGPGSGR
jgi:hypothetical protein